MGRPVRPDGRIAAAVAALGQNVIEVFKPAVKSTAMACVTTVNKAVKTKRGARRPTQRLTVTNNARGKNKTPNCTQTNSNVVGI